MFVLVYDTLHRNLRANDLGCINWSRTEFPLQLVCLSSEAAGEGCAPDARLEEKAGKRRRREILGSITFLTKMLDENDSTS